MEKAEVKPRVIRSVEKPGIVGIKQAPRVAAVSNTNKVTQIRVAVGNVKATSIDRTKANLTKSTPVARV